MPNLIIETSEPNLINEPDTLLAQLNETLWQSGQFQQPSDIKSRYYTPNHCLVGLATTHDNSINSDFIFVQFYLMAGRDSATIQALCHRVVTVISDYLTASGHIANGQLQICVNPVVLSADYCKVLI